MTITTGEEGASLTSNSLDKSRALSCISSTCGEISCYAILCLHRWNSLPKSLHPKNLVRCMATHWNALHYLKEPGRFLTYWYSSWPHQIFLVAFLILHRSFSMIVLLEKRRRSRSYLCIWHVLFFKWINCGTEWCNNHYYLIITWLLLDYCLNITWLLLDYYLIIAWLLLDYYLIFTWLLLDYCLIITWLLLDYCLIIAWLLLDYYLIFTWLLLDYCLIITWLLLDYYLIIMCICNASFFSAARASL